MEYVLGYGEEFGEAVSGGSFGVGLFSTSHHCSVHRVVVVVGETLDGACLYH